MEPLKIFNNSENRPRRKWKRIKQREKTNKLIDLNASIIIIISNVNNLKKLLNEEIVELLRLGRKAKYNYMLTSRSTF